jgi:hypothetical protein
MPLLCVPLAGCLSTSIANDVPDCGALIPQMLLAPIPPAELPEARQLPDGHDDAQPWQIGFIEQTGQLAKANERAPAVDHIYRQCLVLHRTALRRSTRGFFGRLFGG